MSEHIIKYTHIAAGQTDQAIESGQSIRLYGFLVSGVGGAGTATFEVYNTSTVVATVPVISGDTVDFHTPDPGVHLASGLQVTTAANTEVTVIHSRGKVL